MTNNTNYGYLGVTVTTALNSIPIKGATVAISRFEDGVDVPFKILTTNEDGKTDIVLLPTPPRENSLTPNPIGPSYSVYNVRVDKEGYYTQNSLNVPIFTLYQGRRCDEQHPKCPPQYKRQRQPFGR